MLENESYSRFIGVEIYENGIAELLSGLNRKYFNRINIFRNDFRLFLDHTPNNFFQRILVLYPDPWFKRRHNKRRILNHNNIEKLSKSIRKDGLIYIATDIEEYFSFIIQNFNKVKNLSILNINQFHIKPSILGITKYEKKANLAKRASFFLVVKKTSG